MNEQVLIGKTIKEYEEAFGDKVTLNVIADAGNLVNLASELLKGEYSKSDLIPELEDIIAQLYIDVATLRQHYDVSQAEIKKYTKRKLESMKEEYL